MCCVFRPAFRCCAHLKAGRTDFFQPLSTFFVCFKPFSVISVTSFLVCAAPESWSKYTTFVYYIDLSRSDMWKLLKLSFWRSRVKVTYRPQNSYFGSYSKLGLNEMSKLLKQKKLCSWVEVFYSYRKCVGSNMNQNSFEPWVFLVQNCGTILLNLIK